MSGLPLLQFTVPKSFDVDVRFGNDINLPAPDEYAHVDIPEEHEHLSHLCMFNTQKMTYALLIKLGELVDDTERQQKLLEGLTDDVNVILESLPDNVQDKVFTRRTLRETVNARQQKDRTIADIEEKVNALTEKLDTKMSMAHRRLSSLDLLRNPQRTFPPLMSTTKIGSISGSDSDTSSANLSENSEDEGSVSSETGASRQELNELKDKLTDIERKVKSTSSRNHETNKKVNNLETNVSVLRDDLNTVLEAYNGIYSLISGSEVFNRKREFIKDMANVSAKIFDLQRKIEEMAKSQNPE